MRKNRLVGGILAASLAVASFAGVPEMMGFENNTSAVSVSAASFRAGLYYVNKTCVVTIYYNNNRCGSLRLTRGSYVSVSTSGKLNGYSCLYTAALISSGCISFVRG